MEPFSSDYRTIERRVLTFSLSGRASLPESASREVTPVEDPGYQPDPDRAQRGALIFAGNCILCHGFDAVSSGFAPDLRASVIPLSEDAFMQVVKHGALATNGMPMFGELSDEQVRDLRAYLRSQAAEFRQSHGKPSDAVRQTKQDGN